MTGAPGACEHAGMDYRGRVAIVTGASSGIGRQVALDLAARGTALVLSARRRELLEQVAADCVARGVRVEALVGDVAERAFVETMAARAVERLGGIDIVVNNAGVSKHKQLYHLTADEVDYVLRVNFLAPGLFRWGASRFDPVPADVIAAARERARVTA